MTQDELKQAVARAAIEHVPAGGVIGVGTGSTANFFIAELARVHKLATSYAAVLAEPPRFIALVARDLCHAMTRGSAFVDVFNAMRGQYGFSGHAAFTIAIRVFRGGGLTKDIVYLRGLRDLLAYLREGNSFEVLFLGKFSLAQIAALQLFAKVAGGSIWALMFARFASFAVNTRGRRRGLPPHSREPAVRGIAMTASNAGFG